MRTLVLGAMPLEATPETHIASGPWCFAGQEAQFPGWDALWPLPPDPFPDKISMDAAGRAANGAMLHYLPHFAALLNRTRKSTHNREFWDTALSPWLLAATHSLYERWQRCVDMAALYGGEPLRVRLLPAACELSFQNSEDFARYGYLDRDYNHYVFSRFLEQLTPAGWQLEYLPARTLHRATPRRPGLKERLRRLLLCWPFPRVKGFAVWQSALLSLCLLRKFTSPDATRPLSEYADHTAPLPVDLLPLLEQALPRDLAEAPIPRLGDKHGRARVMTGEYLYNDAYSLQLAAWREQGGRLITYQHGGNYGMLYAPGSTVLDHRPHALLTWGWDTDSRYPGNFVPSEHPLISSVTDKHHESQPRLIYVGTEMCCYAGRLKSRPGGKALVAYRREKITFFNALPDAVRGHALYRPYFPTPSALEDAPYLRHFFPDLPLCSGDLTTWLLSCRLTVLDHYGTTMHSALAANTPLVCFWDQTAWGLCPEAEKVLAPLRQAGIVHADAEAAARHCAAVWPDVQGWWRSEATQAARAQWVARHAAGSAAPPWRVFRRWQALLHSL